MVFDMRFEAYELFAKVDEKAKEIIESHCNTPPSKTDKKTGFRSANGKKGISRARARDGVWSQPRDSLPSTGHYAREGGSRPRPKEVAAATSGSPENF